MFTLTNIKNICETGQKRREGLCPAVHEFKLAVLNSDSSWLGWRLCVNLKCKCKIPSAFFNSVWHFNCVVWLATYWWKINSFLSIEWSGPTHNQSFIWSLNNLNNHMRQAITNSKNPHLDTFGAPKGPIILNKDLICFLFKIYAHYLSTPCLLVAWYTFQKMCSNCQFEKFSPNDVTSVIHR